MCLLACVLLCMYVYPLWLPLVWCVRLLVCVWLFARLHVYVSLAFLAVRPCVGLCLSIAECMYVSFCLLVCRRAFVCLRMRAVVFDGLVVFGDV